MLKISKQRGLRPRLASELAVLPKIKRTAADSAIEVTLLDSRLYRAPAGYYSLHDLGTVYRQVYTAQSSVILRGHHGGDTGGPKHVIVCWAGKEVPGVSGEDRDPPVPGASSPIWVSCSCDYFRYNCEWALARYGSSDILYSNGKAAKVTNPRGIPLICKHLYVVIPQSLQDYTPPPHAEEQAPPPEPVQTVQVEEPVEVEEEVSLPEVPEVPEDSLDLSPLPPLEGEDTLVTGSFHGNSFSPSRYSVSAAILRDIVSSSCGH